MTSGYSRPLRAVPGLLWADATLGPAFHKDSLRSFMASSVGPSHHPAAWASRWPTGEEGPCAVVRGEAGSSPLLDSRIEQASCLGWCREGGSNPQVLADGGF